jgi:DNA repair protein RecO (recombination protein O)
MRLSLITPAIVLRVRPFGESDKIVSFLTEKHGKITGIAKGAKYSRKRFVNSLEPFAQVTLRYEDRLHGNLAFLLSAELAFIYKELTLSLERISYASYLVEITDGLIAERDENHSIFEHLKDGLCHLEQQGPSLRFVTAYELRLLRLTGYQPVLDRCKTCGAEIREQAGERWYFSAMDGGVLCAYCSGARRELVPLGANAVKMLTHLQEGQNLPDSPVLLSARVVHEIRATVSSFIQYHVDREIKSAPFLRGFYTV